MSQLDARMSEPLGVTQGLRISAEQHALFAQGRMSLDDVNALRLAVQWAPLAAADNKKVTNAAPGYSWHEFGLAVDVVPFESGGQADWNETHPVWMEIVNKGQELGLKSGISWKDEPHFQLTGRFPDTPTDEVRMIYQQGGVQAVWAAAFNIS
jgi:peptidoglycan L-alanyl-D-glutamate endopeptidase CwlK